MKIALAGASSGVGWHIADAILSRGKHQLTILSRNAIPEFTQRGANVVAVSYDTVEGLVLALSGIHTLISTIGDHVRSGTAQLVLVKAAEAAGVTRFIPSGWAATDFEASSGGEDTIELYRYKQPALAALRESNVQWSFPENGIFLNYFATPTAGIGHLRPNKFWIDVENCRATIPGDGNIKLAYTRIEDVGIFIDRALDYEGEWPRNLRIAGALITHNELVKIAEQARGKTFDVTYLSEAQLREKLVPDASSVFINLVTTYSLAILEGRFTYEPNFNDVVKMDFMTPEEFFQKWWGQAQ